MGKRVSHSLLDPLILPLVPVVYRLTPIPRRFPPEGIIAIGHLLAIAGAIGFALATEFWWAGMLAAAGVLGNHLTDMLDGTHARRTGQCRNGGELLDHFTDPLSFTYWMIGLGLSLSVWSNTERGVWTGLLFAVAASVVIYATALLTNIRAKITGSFVLARFGPTEFKALLVLLGLSLSGTVLLGGEPRLLVGGWMAIMLPVGVLQLLAGLIRAIGAVNRAGAEPDRSDWHLE